MNVKRWLVPLVPAVMGIQIITHWLLLSIAAQVGLITIPWLMNRGYVLYDTVLEHRAPALAQVIALLQRGLPTLEPIVLLQGLNLLLVLAGSLIVTVLAVRMAHIKPQVAGAVALGVWFWWEPSYGNILFYYDSVLGFLIVLAVLVWDALRARTAWGAVLLAGLILGTSTLVKQHGWAAVGVFGLWILLFSGRQRWRDALVYGVGALLLPLGMVAYEALQGNLANYIYWTYTFNLSGYVPPLPPTSAYVYKMLLTHVMLLPFALLCLRDWRQRQQWVLLLGLWLASSMTLLPKFGEIHTMSQLPVLAVMSGIGVAELLREARPQGVWRWLQGASASTLILVGVLLSVAAGWLWAGLVAYTSVPLGRGVAIAYAEFLPLAARLDGLLAPQDTLFVLPALDGNPQLHLMTGALPPRTWTTTHECMLCAPNLTERLLSEWRANPPTYIVYFPELVNAQQQVTPLIDFLTENYILIESFGSLPFNGEALIYRSQN